MEPKRKSISIAETYRNMLASISDDHIFYLQVFIALFIGLLTIYFLTRKVAQTISGSSLVLLGRCESGKTALLYTLASPKGDTPLTVTSFNENVVSIAAGDKNVRMVDIPGHDRVRNTAFDKYKNDAKAILFLLDSATVQSQVRDVAEQLYTVLADATVRSTKCPVAIVCNKQDQEMAKAASVIERALQREIQVLRETTSSRLASIDSDSSSAISDIGVPGQQFSFSDLKSNPVTFIETTVLNASDIDNLKNWISSVA